MAIPYGLGIVAHDLISDSIDFYDANEARATSSILQQYAILIAILTVLAASALRDKLLSFYTSDFDLISQCQLVWIPFMVFMFCLAVNLVVSGALSAVGPANRLVNIF